MTGKDACEYICLSATRGSLEDYTDWYFAEKNRSIGKVGRPELEQTFYTIRVLNLDPAVIYEIKTGSKTLVETCKAYKVVDWIKKNAIFNWNEEQDLPALRSDPNTVVYVKKIGTVSY